MKAKQPTGDADLDGLSSAVDDILTGHQLEIEQSGYATLYLAQHSPSSPVAASDLETHTQDCALTACCFCLVWVASGGLHH